MVKWTKRQRGYNLPNDKIRAPCTGKAKRSCSAFGEICQRAKTRAKNRQFLDGVGSINSNLLVIFDNSVKNRTFFTLENKLETLGER